MTLYSIVFIAILANVLLWGSMWLAERYEAKHGFIPGRKSIDEEGNGFLYLHDWSTASWGDYIGFTLIDIGAVATLTMFWDTPMLATVAVGGIIIASAFYFYSICDSHRPDSSFPSVGKVSLSGKFHLLYYVVQASLGLWAIGALFAFDLSLEVFLITLLGGTVYVIAFLNDFRLRRFSR